MPIPSHPFRRPYLRLGLGALCGALGVLVGGLGTPPAGAQDTASKPVEPPCMTATLIIPWTAGGGTDMIARAVAAAVNKDGQKPPLRVRNIVGRNGIDGRAALRAAAADGCHLGLVQPRMVGDFLTGRDLAPWQATVPVARLTATALAVVGGSRGRASDHARMMDLLANGKVRAAVAPESQGDFLLRLIERDTGGRFLRVASDDGRQQLAFLRRGVADVAVVSLASADRLLGAGEGRVFAVTAKQLRPDMPGLEKLGVRGRFAIDRGIMAPPKTEGATIAWWAGRFEKAMKDKALQARLATFATRPAFLGPEPYTRALEDLTATWRPLARAGGIYRARE